MKPYEHSTIDSRPESPHPITQPTGNLGDVATKANVLFALVVVAAVYFDRGSALAAVLAGAAYYGITNIATLLILSGTLTQTFVALQHHITLRRLHHLQFQAPPSPPASSVTIVDLPQLESRESAHPLPPPGLPLAKSYVPPMVQPSDIDEGTRREVMAWVTQLYGQDGQPDPKKVLLKTDKEPPGRVKIAAPSRVAKRYLLERGVLRDMGGNGYRLNLTRCPTITAAQNRLR